MFAFTVFCLFLSVAADFGDYDPFNVAPMKYTASMFRTCLAETNLSADEYYEVIAWKSIGIPRTQRQECMVACLMRKLNLIKNGKYMVDEAIKAAETYYGNDYQTLFLATEIIDYCARDVLAQSPTNECSLAGKVITCLLATSQRLI